MTWMTYVVSTAVRYVYQCKRSEFVDTWQALAGWCIPLPGAFCRHYPDSEDV